VRVEEVSHVAFESRSADLSGAAGERRSRAEQVRLGKRLGERKQNFRAFELGDGVRSPVWSRVD